MMKYLNYSKKIEDLNKVKNDLINKIKIKLETLLSTKKSRNITNIIETIKKQNNIQQNIKTILELENDIIIVKKEIILIELLCFCLMY